MAPHEEKESTDVARSDENTDSGTIDEKNDHNKTDETQADRPPASSKEQDVDVEAQDVSDPNLLPGLKNASSDH